MTLYRKSNASVVVSMRSRQGQALKVAHKLGGGGHPNAAGATLPKSVRSINEAITYLEAIFKTEPAHTQINPLDDLFKGLKF